MKVNVSDNSARLAAKRIDLVARKSRRAVGSIENRGGFMLVDLFSGIPVAGFNYDLSPEEVLEFCLA